MPANLGYMTAMLYNPNNCAAEASPVTTQYELEVGQGLCKMLGYEDRSTGHLVTGGSLANIEGVWAARNLKYYALGLQDAVANEPRLQAAQDYPVYIPALQRKLPLSKATQWQLLNLNIDPDVVEMPDAVLDWVNKKGSGKELTSTDLKDILKGYAYETLGTQEFCRRHNLKKPACFLTPSTCHVSFVKAATILGLGKENIDLVPVDDRARMNTDGKGYFPSNDCLENCDHHHYHHHHFHHHHHSITIIIIIINITITICSTIITSSPSSSPSSPSQSPSPWSTSSSPLPSHHHHHHHHQQQQEHQHLCNISMNLSTLSLAVSIFASRSWTGT